MYEKNRKTLTVDSSTQIQLELPIVFETGPPYLTLSGSLKTKMLPNLMTVLDSLDQIKHLPAYEENQDESLSLPQEKSAKEKADQKGVK